MKLAEGSHILSNGIRLENKHSKTVSFGIRIRVPEHWKVVSRIDSAAVGSFFLEPGGRKHIALNLLHTSKARPGWDSIRVTVWCYSPSDTLSYYIKIKSEEHTSYTLQPLTGDQNFTHVLPESIPLGVLIKNTGNVPDTYAVACLNTTLNWHYKSSFGLAPGKDTVVRFEVHPSAADWRAFQFTTLPLVVGSQRLQTDQSVYYQVKKVSSTIIAQRPTGKEIPLTFGGGMMVAGSRMMYYGQAGAQVSLGNHFFSVNYRSREFGTLANTFQPNATSLVYRYKNFQLSGGQIQAPRNFFTFGQGVNFLYSTQRTQVSLSALKRNANTSASPVQAQNNDNLYGHIHYQWRKVRISHRVESSFNDYLKLNSYLASSEVVLLKAGNTELRANAGIGTEDRLNAPPGMPRMVIGFAGGYELATIWKSFGIKSSVQYQSSRYPGIFQGMQQQLHEVRKNIRKSYAYAAFFSNAMRQNILRDTLYNTDFLITNSIKAGIGYGADRERYGYRLGVGQLVQAGRQYSYAGGTYTDVSAQVKLGNNGSLALSTSNAFDSRASSLLWTTNSQLQLTSRHVGFIGFYNRVPQFGEEINAFFETVSLNPSVSWSLCKNQLYLFARYSAAKTLSETVLRHGFGGDLRYSGQKTGLTIGANGFYPLKDPAHLNLPLTEVRTANVYLLKRINIPLKRIPTHTIRFTLFHDLNNNKLLDSGEEPLPSRFFSCNNNILITDEQGHARYTNLSAGTYAIDLLPASVEGLVPTGGPVSTVALLNDEEILLPFHRGIKLHGTIRIINDSLSHTSMTPDNFKVTIRDTTGQDYYALSNAQGYFSAMLPEGIYTVSINGEAFKGSDFVPDKLLFEVRLSNHTAFEPVRFIIRQKQRKIRFLNSSKN